MELHRIDLSRDIPHLRRFLAGADPGDYLLEGLEEWVHTGRSWVGVVEGDWVAFGRLHDLGGAEGWISGLRVDPARRGHGIGSELLAKLLSDARELGVTALRAVIEDPNIPSRRLFARFGFRSVAPMTLGRGLARAGPAGLLRRASAGEGLDGPVGWLPSLSDRVDLLPGEEGGRFGRWQPWLAARWATEGKLFLGPGLAVAVQVDWWEDPRTLWANPLRGTPGSLFAALGSLTRELEHEEWQAFLPSSESARAEYATCGILPHPSWGDRVQLYERL